MDLLLDLVEVRLSWEALAATALGFAALVGGLRRAVRAENGVRA